MTLARMAVSLPCSQSDDGLATLWLSVTAFGRQADALAKHHKGELLSVAGNMQMSQWTGQNRRNAAGLAGYRRQRNQCAIGATGRQKGQQGQATDALNRAKQQADQQGSQPPEGDNEQWGDDIPF